jgi:copper(I)-binding protein
LTPSRRARRSIALAVVAGLTLTGCGAGINAQTNQRRTYAEGNNEIFPGGQIIVGNMYLAPPDNEPLGKWEEGDDVRGYLVIVNQGDEQDRLLRVTSPVASRVSFWAGGDPEFGVAEHTAEFLDVYQPGSEARPGGTDTRALPGDAADDVEADPDGVSPSASPSPEASAAAEPGAEVGVDTGLGGDGRPVDSYLIPVGDKTEVLPGAGYLLFEDLLVDVYPGTTVEVTMEFEQAGSNTFPAYVHVLSEPYERETPGTAEEGKNEEGTDSTSDLEAGH